MKYCASSLNVLTASFDGLDDRVAAGRALMRFASPRRVAEEGEERTHIVLLMITKTSNAKPVRYLACDDESIVCHFLIIMDVDILCEQICKSKAVVMHAVAGALGNNVTRIAPLLPLDTLRYRRCMECLVIVIRDLHMRMRGATPDGSGVYGSACASIEIITIKNGKGKAQVNDTAWPCSSLQNFESCAQLWNQCNEAQCYTTSRILIKQPVFSRITRAPKQVPNQSVWSDYMDVEISHGFMSRSASCFG